MSNFIVILLSVIGAFILGSTLAPTHFPSLPSNPPEIQDFPSEIRWPSQPYSHSWHSLWHRVTDCVLEFYHPRSLVGHLVVGMHDPEIRSLAGSYLQQAWEQIKEATNNISPEAAAKLKNDLEPMAEKTLTEVEDRLGD